MASNAKVVASATKFGGQAVRNALEIKRMGATSVYGVFEVSVLKKLVEKGAKIQNKIGNITVSAIKYTDGEADEATITLSKTWKVKGQALVGSASADKANAYTKKVIDTFGSIKVK